MAPRYERINGDESPTTPRRPTLPNSPPPSFRSRPSSPEREHADTDALVDSFDAPSDDEDDNHDLRDASNASTTVLPHTSNTTTLNPAPLPKRMQPGVGSGMQNDGVFANLNAKPSTATDKPADELPPSYEAAAADATPPYWETTIMAPGMFDDPFVDGLPVGSVFAFIWNALVSLSFQFIGFLLTYLLHTTHAAKHGSRAGLGITLVQYGFYTRSSPADPFIDPDYDPSKNNATPNTPPEPNAYDFATSGLPSDTAVAAAAASSGGSGLSNNDWLSYVLMVVGWFILIRAISDFLRARRTEQVILASPDRGLGVAVVAEGERPEASV